MVLNQFRGFWTKRKSKSRNVRAFMRYHFLTFPTVSVAHPRGAPIKVT